MLMGGDVGVGSVRVGSGQVRSGHGISPCRFPVCSVSICGQGDAKVGQLCFHDRLTWDRWVRWWHDVWFCSVLNHTAVVPSGIWKCLNGLLLHKQGRSTINGGVLCWWRLLECNSRYLFFFFFPLLCWSPSLCL